MTPLCNITAPLLSMMADHLHSAARLDLLRLHLRHKFKKIQKSSMVIRIFLPSSKLPKWIQRSALVFELKSPRIRRLFRKARFLLFL
jgi:hypothetical protein